MASGFNKRKLMGSREELITWRIQNNTSDDMEKKYTNKRVETMLDTSLLQPCKGNYVAFV